MGTRPVKTTTRPLLNATHGSATYEYLQIIFELQKPVVMDRKHRQRLLTCPKNVFLLCSLGKSVKRHVVAQW